LFRKRFLKSYRHLSQFQGRSSYAAWLYRIAVNESRTLLRRRRNDLPWDETIEAFSASSQSLSLEEEVVKTQETNILKAAMLRLSPEDRLILSLRYDQELSYEEISEITQIPKNTVGTRIYRAKKQLMVWLKDGEMENAHRVSN
jgi:RNA polymerase sigma-70 factor (ECF subfamily)